MDVPTTDQLAMARDNPAFYNLHSYRNTRGGLDVRFRLGGARYVLILMREGRVDIINVMYYMLLGVCMSRDQE